MFDENSGYRRLFVLTDCKINSKALTGNLQENSTFSSEGNQQERLRSIDLLIEKNTLYKTVFGKLILTEYQYFVYGRNVEKVLMNCSLLDVTCLP